jgi:AraC family transcriptional regulator of adaptative response / DNA-3-methyladenine glycosylase II
MSLTPVLRRLDYRPPYDWDALLAFLAARAIPGVEAISDGAYHRTIELGGAAGDIRISHQPEKHQLLATIHFPDSKAAAAIVRRLRDLFDLNTDPRTVGAALSRDPRLAPLVAARPGLRVPGAWDGFELAVRAIVGQQISVPAATRLVGRIADTWGEPLPGGPTELGLKNLFPRPSALAEATIGGMPRARAAAIASMARSAAANPALFERGADLASSIARLRALPGVGDWTAHYIAMRALREPDAFPAADIGLMRAMDDGAGRPNARALLARAEAWRPWRAYAALHLWASWVPTASKPETNDAIAA